MDTASQLRSASYPSSRTPADRRGAGPGRLWHPLHLRCAKQGSSNGPVLDWTLGSYPTALSPAQRSAVAVTRPSGFDRPPRNDQASPSRWLVIPIAAMLPTPSAISTISPATATCWPKSRRRRARPRPARVMLGQRPLRRSGHRSVCEQVAGRWSLRRGPAGRNSFGASGALHPRSDHVEHCRVKRVGMRSRLPFLDPADRARDRSMLAGKSDRVVRHDADGQVNAASFRRKVRMLTRQRCSPLRRVDIGAKRHAFRPRGPLVAHGSFPCDRADAS